MAEREQIDETPFHVVGNKDRGYFITLGKFRLTEAKPTMEEAIELLGKEHWNIILILIATVLQIDQEKKSKRKSDTKK